MSDVQFNNAEPETRKLPYWFTGVIICFFIFVASIIYFGMAVENVLKTNPDGNAPLGYGLLGLAINVILLPIIFGIFALASFFQRKRTAQFKDVYICLTAILLIIGTGLAYSSKFLFPVTNEATVEACSLLKSPELAARCFERNAIKEKDPSICDKIDYAAMHGPDVQEQEAYKNSCYENVKRGHW